MRKIVLRRKSAWWHEAGLSLHSPSPNSFIANAMFFRLAENDAVMLQLALQLYEYIQYIQCSHFELRILADELGGSWLSLATTLTGPKWVPCQCQGLGGLPLYCIL
jgi:hypothetical protein